MGRKFLDPRSPNAALPFSGVKIFYFFMFALLFLALYLTFLLIQPFLHTIILACIFTALSHPLYRKLYLHFWENGWIAAGLTLFLLVILVCLPLIFFTVQLMPQATQSLAALAQWLSGAHLDALLNEEVYPFLTWLNEELTWVNLDVADMRSSLMNISRQAGQIMLAWGTSFVVDSLTMFANFLLMLLIMFFLLKDGEHMLGSLRRLTPLRTDQGDRIISNLRRMAKAVLIGGFMVAALQGLVGGIGLAIVGIQPLFWGTVMAFAALVPVLGTALVWIPAVIYLLLINQVSSAMLLLGWCAILVTSIDSFLRPIIIRGSSKTSLLFLFIAVIGGIKAFGVLGIVYGPLILSFVGVMLAIYSDEYRASLSTFYRALPPGNKALSPGSTAPSPGMSPSLNRRRAARRRRPKSE
jgi:predicted PurR-regulated permease PerM